MKEWTFLLQKYGDRSWLPLDSPDIEILEGRYRIVVQTEYPNTDINIRICHLATEEEPPKRRIQKRTNCTNANGLMVVTPFTALQAGNWELSCFLVDPLSDLVGDMLHQAVRLRVLADVEQADSGENAAAILEDSANPSIAAIAPDQPRESTPAHPPDAAPIAAPSVREVAALNLEIAQALGFSMERLVEMTDQLSHQLIEEIFQEFDLAATVNGAAIAEPAAPTEAPAIAAPLVDPAQPVTAVELEVEQLQIVLAQDGWMATKGQPLAIAGRLELASVSRETTAPGSPADAPSLESELAGAVPQELQIQFRDPQTSKVLFHACQSFPMGVPPMPFTFLCHLPDDLTTHLLLGEVIIAGTLPGAATVLVTLKTFNFTVTVDPQGLVAELQKVQTALAEKAEQDELGEVVTQFSHRLQREKESHSLDLSFLKMAAPIAAAVATADSPPAIADSASACPSLPQKQILPPQLYKPDADQSVKRKLELPAFVGVGVGLPACSDALIADTPPPAETTDNLDTVNDIYLDGDRDTLAAVEAGDRPLVEPPSEAPEVEASQPPVAYGQSDLAMIDELSSPIRTAFQALNLQDKFLTRLSSMAADTELTTLLKLTLPPTEETGVAPDPREPQPVAVAVEPLPLSDSQLQPDTTEIVVEDDPVWQAWVKRAGFRPKSLEAPVETLPPNPLVLPPDEPVPLPVLELGIEEIVAGKPINVRVKLPNVLPKIYVKLWINDRQTRTMLDGPRWLVDFLPNGFDELEAATQITAPFGSLSIRLEAIAVEMQTQRESQKVSLECEVIPTELPEDLFAEFDY